MTAYRTTYAPAGGSTFTMMSWVRIGQHAVDAERKLSAWNNGDSLFRFYKSATSQNIGAWWSYGLANSRALLTPVQHNYEWCLAAVTIEGTDIKYYAARAGDSAMSLVATDTAYREWETDSAGFKFYIGSLGSDLGNMGVGRSLMYNRVLPLNDINANFIAMRDEYMDILVGDDL